MRKYVLDIRTPGTRVWKKQNPALSEEFDVGKSDEIK
jgi:hypothetical protein